jgi:DNA-binding ferritin-like protein
MDPSMLMGILSPQMLNMQPQSEHYAAPIVDKDGRQIGGMEVHKETIPIGVAIKGNDYEEDDEKMKGEAKQNLAQMMLCVAACVKELETQAHLIHLNYQGSNFLSIHKFLKEQYDKHVLQFDYISEMLRSLDFYMPMCSKGLAEACHDFKHCTSMDGVHMLSTYLCNIENVGMKSKCMSKMAKCADAEDVENLAAEFVRDMFKDAFLLKSTLRPGKM